MSVESAAKAISSKAANDFDDLKEHLTAIRHEIASLASSTGKLAINKARGQAKLVGNFAREAADTAAHYRDAAGDKIKAHPFAAIGIAVLGGLILASLARRS